MNPPPAAVAQVRFLLMVVAAVACTNAAEPLLSLFTSLLFSREAI
jgi:hypothetical protein